MKPKLIAFDVDGTLTEGNIWERLNDIIGLSHEQDLQWYLDYYNKKITFEQWTKNIVNAYKKSGKKQQDFMNVFTRVPFIQEAKSILKTIQESYHVCLISSGVDEYVNEVAKQLNITLFHANYHFVYDSTGTFVDCTFLAPENEAKVLILKQFCQQLHILPTDVMYVGDSSNDLEVFQLTQHGVLVGEGNEQLIKASWKQIRSLREILQLISL